MKQNEQQKSSQVLNNTKEALVMSCPVQPFAWGKKGKTSLVNRLADVQQDLPGAELWVGAHPKKPAMLNLADGPIALDKFISENAQSVLGERVFAAFGATLPFLFKILSIGSALSIQAHPDKKLAEELHRRDPKNYPDSNHKPEMALALSPLVLLCGFNEALTIKSNVELYPELAAVIGEGLARQVLNGFSTLGAKEIQSRVFAAIMQAEKGLLKQETEKLRQRLAGKSDLSLADKWFLKLADLYGQGDPGLFCLYVLKLLTLEPGQAVYLGPNIPHAYLDGDIVECMANSDNVVRAGLTEKFIDSATLVAMLERESAAPLFLGASETAQKGVRTYHTPAAEFVVDEISSGEEMSFHSDGSVQLLFSVDAAGLFRANAQAIQLSSGSAILMPAGIESYSVKLSSGSLYRVRVP